WLSSFPLLSLPVALPSYGHRGDLGLLGGADGQRLDVEPAPAEPPRDPGQDARLVLDQHRQRVLAHLSPRASAVAGQRSSSSNSGAMSRANLMSSLLVPAATIGQTIASRCTRKSPTTGTSSISIAFWMVASTSAGLSQARPTAPYASAGLTKSGTRLLCRSVLEYRSL